MQTTRCRPAGPRQRRRRAAVVGLTAALVLGGRSAAHAQILDNIVLPGVPGYENDPGATVLSHARTGYESPGIALGDFTIRPNLNEGLGYNSNVVGRPGNGSAPSAVVDTAATIQANSNWSRDSIGFLASVDNTQYPGQPAQTVTAYDFSAGGTYQIGRDQLTVALSHLRRFETTSGIDAFNIVTPVPYNIDDLRASYLTTFGRFSFRPEVEVSAYRFVGGSAAPLGVPSQTQDTNVLQGGLTTEYELATLRNLVLMLRAAQISYINGLEGLPNRDSTGATALAGLDYAAAGVFRYFLLLGYQIRHYQSAEYRAHEAPVFRGGVVWSPTRLTTVTLTASRSIEDSTDQTLVGYTLTQFGVVVDHELLRNVLLQGSVQYLLANYDQSPINQTLYSVGLGATWLLNRRVSLGLQGMLTGRVSNAGGDYTGTQVLLRLGFRL